MQILDLFGGGGAHNQGVATFELPSDGAKEGDVRKVLEGLAGAVDGVAGVWNAFKGDVQDGKATQTVIATGETPAGQELSNLAKTARVLLPLLVVAFAAWFFLRRR